MDPTCIKKVIMQNPWNPWNPWLLLKVPKQLQKIYLSAEHVERLAWAVLNHGQYGLSRLSPSIPLQDVVVRMFLTSSKSYKCFRHSKPIPNQIHRNCLADAEQQNAKPQRR
jgi:hypothetical protein